MLNERWCLCAADTWFPLFDADFVNLFVFGYLLRLGAACRFPPVDALEGLTVEWEQTEENDIVAVQKCHFNNLYMKVPMFIWEFAVEYGPVVIPAAVQTSFALFWSEGGIQHGHFNAGQQSFCVNFFEFLLDLSEHLLTGSKSLLILGAILFTYRY